VNKRKLPPPDWQRVLFRALCAVGSALRSRYAQPLCAAVMCSRNAQPLYEFIHRRKNVQAQTCSSAPV